jgi:uncharacterized protein YxjI
MPCRRGPRATARRVALPAALAKGADRVGFQSASTDPAPGQLSIGGRFTEDDGIGAAHVGLINAHSHPDHLVIRGNLGSPEKEGEYMGLFRRGDDGGRRFVMREKLLSIGDDFWIRDDDGNKVFKVNGKALRVRKTLILEDDSGNELVHIQDRVLNLRGTMKLERHGEDLATVHKALIGIRDRYEIDVESGEDLKATGNVLAHEYEVKRDGDVIATVTRKWVRARETYGIEIAAGEDEPFLLAVAVAIDQLAD